MHNDSFHNPLNTVNTSVAGSGQSGCSINVPGSSSDCNQTSFQAESIEHIGSGKYVSIQNVAARLARNVKGKQFDIYDIAEWCGECETDEIGMYEGFVKYRNVRVLVKQNKAYLPCNIYRILSVHRNKCNVPKYQWDGAYLRFNFDDPGTFNDEFYIEVDYLGVAVDNQGLPMILDGNQEACFWYIMTKLYFEDYMNKLVDENRYMFLQDRLGHYVTKSKGSFRHTTRDDMNEIQMILHNLVPKVRMSRDID
jgi:hypothetical protein